MSSIREFLFKGFMGCSDGYCIVNGRAKGMHTNGGCRCFKRFDKASLSILEGRIRQLNERDLPEPPKEAGE